MLNKRRKVLIKSFSTSFKLNIRINIKNDCKSVSKDKLSILLSKKYFSLYG